jgi:hypothetical protein
MWWSTVTKMQRWHIISAEIQCEDNKGVSLCVAGVLQQVCLCCGWYAWNVWSSTWSAAYHRIIKTIAKCVWDVFISWFLSIQPAIVCLVCLSFLISLRLRPPVPPPPSGNMAPLQTWILLARALAPVEPQAQLLMYRPQLQALKVQAREKMAKFLETITMNIKQRWDEGGAEFCIPPIFLYHNTKGCFTWKVCNKWKCVI